MLTNLPHSHLLPKNIKHLQGSECQLYSMIEVYETFSWRLQQTQNMDRTTNSLFYKAPTWPSHRGSPDSRFHTNCRGGWNDEYCEMTRIGEWSVNMTTFLLDKNHVIVSNCRAYPWGYDIATLARYQKHDSFAIVSYEVNQLTSLSLNRAKNHGNSASSSGPELI